MYLWTHACCAVSTSSKNQLDATERPFWILPNFPDNNVEPINEFRLSRYIQRGSSGTQQHVLAPC